MKCYMQVRSWHSGTISATVIAHVAEPLHYQGKPQSRYRKQLLQLEQQMFSSLTGRRVELGFQFLAKNFSATETLKGTMPIGSKIDSFLVNQAKELAA